MIDLSISAEPECVPEARITNGHGRIVICARTFWNDTWPLGRRRLPEWWKRRRLQQRQQPCSRYALRVLARSHEDIRRQPAHTCFPLDRPHQPLLQGRKMPSCKCPHAPAAHLFQNPTRSSLPLLFGGGVPCPSACPHGSKWGRKLFRGETMWSRHRWYWHVRGKIGHPWWQWQWFRWAGLPRSCDYACSWVWCCPEESISPLSRFHCHQWPVWSRWLTLGERIGCRWQWGWSYWSYTWLFQCGCLVKIRQLLPQWPEPVCSLPLLSRVPYWWLLRLSYSAPIHLVLRQSPHSRSWFGRPDQLPRILLLLHASTVRWRWCWHCGHRKSQYMMSFYHSRFRDLPASFPPQSDVLPLH